MSAAERLPAEGFLGQARLGMGMIAATAAPESSMETGVRERGPEQSGLAAKSLDQSRRREGAAGLGKRPDGHAHRVRSGGPLGRVNRATVRVLEANGFQVVEVPDQGCCGAIHAHTGDLEGARELARANIQAFEALELDFIAVNAAGCGAAMKDYPHLLADDAEYR